MSVWRVGRKLGRTIYKDDAIVGLVDTPELAAEIVARMNEPSPVRAERTQTEDCPAVGSGGQHSQEWYDGECCQWCGAK